MRQLYLALVLGLAGSLAHAAAPPAKRPPVSRPIDFTRDIKPIFDKSCISCHGSEKQRGGLRLDDGTQAMKGSNSGPIIKPGDGAGSRLFVVVGGLDPDMVMPPGKGKSLTSAEVGLLRAWIEQGAKWPASERVLTTKNKSNHWAFQPIGSPAIPTVADPKWLRNPLDAFILARLEKEKITPSPEADAITLLRRVTLDLTGLPPTPAEVEAFLHDRSPNAYEKAVERLLASPAYGEKWARHWLDQARYADSDGYEKDTGRPNAWRYREWVINALNRDLPYNRFVIEQLAGDLLPGASSDQKAATGFHRNTLTNKEGGVDQEQFRVEAVIDRVNTTGKVFLGVTLGCAQCHDHKYDPFSQREYYQFFAFFNSDVEIDLPAPLPGDSRDPTLDSSLAKTLKETEAKDLAYRKSKLPDKLAGWEKSLTATQRKALPAAVRTALALAADKRDAKQQKAIADHFATLDPELMALTETLANLRKELGSRPMAQTLALGPGRKTNVMIRGDFLRSGVEVQPGTPEVFPLLKAKSKATRLDLAQWLVDPANPLTARVVVNWIWHRYFGRGIVPTLEDFGTQGEKPSHPELLDHLASQLIQRGWSLKELHRAIVTSAVYRQSSAVRPELLSRDPNNVLLARQARLRLEAETIRDVTLASSGLLVRTVGGRSVRPPQPQGISELTYAGSARWVESTGADRYRRGLYTWFQRTSPYPMLLTFDAPDSNICSVRRERSNTPLQALTLLNDTTFVECARSLAERVLSEEKANTKAQLEYAFRLCVARTPTSSEQARLLRLYEELRSLAESDPRGAAKLIGKDNLPQGVSSSELAAWVAMSRALLNLDEVVTRE